MVKRRIYDFDLEKIFILGKRRVKKYLVVKVAGCQMSKRHINERTR